MPFLGAPIAGTEEGEGLLVAAVRCLQTLVARDPREIRGQCSAYTLSRRPAPVRRREARMAFTFKLERPDWTPADPPTLRSAVPNWTGGRPDPFGPGGPALLVVGLRNASDPEHHALLVVTSLAARYGQ